jgi:isopropylmalate/homocitrate/citramalate synthase
MGGHLNADEQKAILEAVRRRRTPETYAPGKWSVSPLNRDPVVLGSALPAAYPKRVRIRDITLRTIEQAPNVVIDARQRMRLAEMLVNAGVGSLMLAWLSTPHEHSTLQQEIAALRTIRPDLELVAIGADRIQIDRAVDSGVRMFEVYSPCIPEFHPIYGPYGRMILRAHWRGEDWRTAVRYPKSEDEQLAMFHEQIDYVKEQGIAACAFASMLHYATPAYLARFARTAKAAGADEITLGDGASGLGPEAWAYIVGLIKQEAPGVPVGLHTHNAFGLVMASTMAGIHAGAEVVEVSVNGLCSAAGQADLAEVVAALEVIYGVSTGIRLEALTPLRRLVEDISGIRMAANKAVTGEHAWTYTEEAMREESAYAPVHKAAEPSLFGNRARYVLGPHSGSWGMLSKLDELGLHASPEAVDGILKQIKEDLAIRRRGLSDEEIDAVARDFGAVDKPAAQSGLPDSK